MTRAAAAKSSAGAPRGQAQMPAFSWPFLGRVLLKALLLFAVFNLIFAALYPMGALGRVSFYNLLFPGRERFPFGENPQQSYNLSIYNLDAMFSSLALNAAPRPRRGGIPRAGGRRFFGVGHPAASCGYPGWQD